VLDEVYELELDVAFYLVLAEEFCPVLVAVF